MGYSHIAIVTRDLAATHRFYTEAMGFELAKVIAAPTPSGTGWARHVFYDTGDGTLLAVWDLHDDEIGEFNPAISRGLGLPEWVNHIAFDASDLEDLEVRRKRWLEHGLDCARIDHGWCTSIYTDDPSGNLVEFCAMTNGITPEDKVRAAELLTADEPEFEPTPDVELFAAG